MLMKNHFFLARTHITVFQRLAMALAIAVFGGNAAAQEIQAGGKDRQLVHDGVLYEYKATPIPASASDPIPSGHMGKIYVTRQNGTLEFSQETRGGGALAPGCDGDFPTISLIDVPYADGGKSRTHVLFCGSDGGRRNTLMFYRPGTGMVGTFDVGNFIPVIYQDAQNPETIIYKEITLDSVCSSVVYPVVYGISSEGANIHLAAKTNLSARKKYAEIAGKIKFIDASLPDTQTIRGVDNRCLQPNVYRPVVEKLIVTHLAGMYTEYCELRKRFEEKKDFFQELKLKASISLLKCED